jgi:hypothetical protein
VIIARKQSEKLRTYTPLKMSCVSTLKMEIELCSEKDVNIYTLHSVTSQKTSFQFLIFLEIAIVPCLDRLRGLSTLIVCFLPGGKAGDMKLTTRLRTVPVSKSHYVRQSVGQSVLVSGAHLGPATNFTFALKFSSDSCVFVIL